MFSGPSLSRVIFEELRLSVEFKGGLVFVPDRGILPCFIEKAIADCQRIDRGSHKASPRVFGRARDRLATHVEAGVYEDRASCALTEGAEQRMVACVGLAMHGLNARRIINVRDRGNLRPHGVQPLYSE